MPRLILPTWKLALYRAEGALREVGVLLVAFAPLDLAFSETSDAVAPAILFFSLGVVFFLVALLIEARRTTDA